MKIFDKAQWHIDAGENSLEVVDKFKLVFLFLEKQDLLAEDGKEMLEIGIDSSISLNEQMVTERGCDFLENCYDDVIELHGDELVKKLDELYQNFTKNFL